MKNIHKRPNRVEIEKDKIPYYSNEAFLEKIKRYNFNIAKQGTGKFKYNAVFIDLNAVEETPTGEKIGIGCNFKCPGCFKALERKYHPTDNPDIPRLKHDRYIRQRYFQEKDFKVVNRVVELAQEKDTTPAHVLSVYNNLEAAEPKNHFTISIVDDVTFTSLPILPEIEVAAEDTFEGKIEKWEWNINDEGFIETSTGDTAFTAPSEEDTNFICIINVHFVLMEELILEATEKFPEIQLKDGLISISGRSIPEDPKKEYKPVLQWVKDYVKNPPPSTEVRIKIEYSDTGSTKCIFDILKVLAVCRNTNHKIEMVFNWIYEKGDGEIVELGEFMENKLNVMFNYIQE